MAKEFTTFEELQTAVSGKGVVLVDCYTTWCGPCKMMAPVINELATEFEGKALISKVDVEGVAQAGMNLKVSAVPTLVIFKDGQEVARKVGFTPKQELTRILNNFLR